MDSFVDGGSSPHTRGARAVAPAGSRAVRDHPRIRGEHGLSQTERLLATFAPIPNDTPAAPHAETPPTPRTPRGPDRDQRRRSSRGMN